MPLLLSRESNTESGDGPAVALDEKQDGGAAASADYSYRLKALVLAARFWPPDFPQLRMGGPLRLWVTLRGSPQLCRTSGRSASVVRER